MASIGHFSTPCVLKVLIMYSSKAIGDKEAHILNFHVGRNGCHIISSASPDAVRSA